MTFNKPQKVATVIYIVLLVSIIFFLTPYDTRFRGYGEKGFGNLFTEDSVEYTKLFIEIGLLTITYYLSLIILKNKSGQIK